MNNQWKALVLCCGVMMWAQAETATLERGKLGFSCEENQDELFTAARHGYTDMVALFFENACDISVVDERGFNVYDISLLLGNAASMRWLEETGRFEAGNFSESLYKLLQSGLRFLGYDAGPIDGKMGKRTAEAIRAFQEKNERDLDGQITPDWMPTFRRELIEKMQTALNQLGYKAGKADGIMGTNTRNAMLAFRKDRKIDVEDYSYFDGAFFYQLYKARDENKRKAKAKTANERARAATTPRKVSKNPSTKSMVRDVQHLSPTDVSIKSAENSKTSASGFTTIKGQIYFQVEGKTLRGCSLSGTKIDLNWCSPFYPASRNKPCEAVLTKDHKIVSLWCK